MITNLDFEASGLEPDSYPIQVATAVMMVWIWLLFARCWGLTIYD